MPGLTKEDLQDFLVPILADLAVMKDGIFAIRQDVAVLKGDVAELKGDVAEL